MDAAEAWLREHDPNYARQSRSWRHVRGRGDDPRTNYAGPGQEIPWDEDEKGPVSDLVDRGYGGLIYGGGKLVCESCGALFEPSRLDGNGQRFCRDACRQRAGRRRRKSERATHRSREFFPQIAPIQDSSSRPNVPPAGRQNASADDDSGALS